MSRSTRCLFFVALCLIGISRLQATPTVSKLLLKCISWNVNGVPKFGAMTPEVRYLEGFHVIFLQETFTTSPENGFELHGYIPYHVLGQLTGGRPSWGLTTLLKINSFVGGSLKPIPSPFDWLQVTRWRRPSDRGILLVNIYVAVYTRGFDFPDARAATEYLSCLRSDYPGDSLLLGGDLNVDTWRLQSQRSSGLTIPKKIRY
jgi:hypothetical protein